MFEKHSLRICFDRQRKAESASPRRLLVLPLACLPVSEVSTLVKDWSWLRGVFERENSTENSEGSYPRCTSGEAEPRSLSKCEKDSFFSNSNFFIPAR